MAMASPEAELCADLWIDAHSLAVLVGCPPSAALPWGTGLGRGGQGTQELHPQRFDENAAIIFQPPAARLRTIWCWEWFSQVRWLGL